MIIPQKEKLKFIHKKFDHSIKNNFKVNQFTNIVENPSLLSEKKRKILSVLKEISVNACEKEN